MANKKINQLVSKTSILSTDLFGIGDATTGQLFKKTIAELQAAIGGAVISVNGLVGTVVLDTDDIQELATPTNKYFTDARARAAISLTVTGNSGASTYSSGTGVLNVPTYTLAGLGGITASFLSGTSGISYNSTTGVISYSGTVYTDSSIRALLSGSTGITYNSSTGAISYSGTVYTDSSVRALISLTTTGSSGASTYNNTTGVINVPEYTLAGLGGISLTSLSGGTGITYNSSTGAISYSGTVYTDASVRALISASGAVSYNNTTGVISLSGGNLTEATSSVLTITGGTGAVLGSGTSIQVKQATTSVSGFLSSTDWTTFNNKANALSGTTNYVAKFTSSSAIGNSIIFDNATGIGINTNSPFGSSAERTIHLTDASGGFATIYVTNTANTVKTILGMQSSNALGVVGTQSNNPFIIVTNDTERVRLTSDGKIGIGTSSPVGAASDDLVTQIYNSVGGGSASRAMIRFTNSYSGSTWGNGSWISIDSGLDLYIANSEAANMYFQTSGTTRMTIASTGNVGISTSTFPAFSGATQLTLKGTSTNTNGIFQVQSYDSGTSLTIYSGAASGDDPLILYQKNLRFGSATDTGLASYTERGRVTSGGNWLLGTTSDNGERLYVSGAIRATGTITANSDITLKKNLLKIENALEKVEQINGYTYELKADDSKRHAGVIAQEIQTVLPEIVNKGNDGILGVEYGNISALLIEAIKEQQTQINELKALLNK